MNPRLLTFLVWVILCAVTVATHPLLTGLVMIATISMLALGLRWVCRTLLQAPATVTDRDAIESVRQETY